MLIKWTILFYIFLLGDCLSNSGITSDKISCDFRTTTCDYTLDNVELAFMYVRPSTFDRDGEMISPITGLEGDSCLSFIVRPGSTHTEIRVLARTTDQAFEIINISDAESRRKYLLMYCNYYSTSH